MLGKASFFAKMLLMKLILFLLLISISTHAGYFNWGAGVLSMRLPHYRGANQTKDYYLPTPYIIYQGDELEAESAVLIYKFLHNKFFSIQLSVNGGLKVDSDESEARSGMPPLNYTFEVGPMFIFHLYQTDTLGLQFEFPIRQVFNTDFTDLHMTGISAAAYLTLYLDAPNQLDWGLEIFSGPLWGDHKLHNYYYTVRPEYELATRATYQAHSGYAGYLLGIIGKYKIGHFIMHPFLRYDNLSHAVFEDSPLVKKKSYAMFGLGLYYLWF